MVPFLLSRLLFALLLAGAASVEIERVPAREGANYHLLFAGDSTHSLEQLRSTLLSADGHWYLELALRGYDSGPFTASIAKNWVLFPLYPLLVHAIGKYFPHYLTVELIINGFSFFLALILLHQLALRSGFKLQQASRAVWACALFPTSSFFSLPMSEAVFFLLFVGTYLLLSLERARLAGVCMLLAGACRPTGLIVLPAFFMSVYAAKHSTRSARWFAACIAPLGALAYMTYLYYLTGNALAFAGNQPMWGRSESIIFGFGAALNEISSNAAKPWNFVSLQLLFTILDICAAGYWIRRRNIGFTLICVLPVIAAFSTGTLIGIGRYVATLFPLYLAMSKWTDHPTVERVWLTLSAALYAFYCLAFVLHLTVAMT